MSVAAQRALRSAIADHRFDPVYYVHGNDDFRKDAAVAELIAAAVDPSTREFNLDVLRGGSVDAARLSLALDGTPMLADRRVVVVRDVGALKKPAHAVLERYVENPSPQVVLVLVAPADAPTDAAMTDRAVSIAFPLLDDDDVPAWLTQRARKLGLELTPDAAALLASVVGADLGHGAGELAKLAAYSASALIGADAVEAIAGVRRETSPGALLDAVAERDAARALALVGPVLSQPKASAVTIVMALATQTLAMSWGRAARDAGMGASRLESEFYALLRNGLYPGRAWGDAVKCWARNLSRWSAPDLTCGLGHLLAADVALKDSRVSTEDEVLSSLVLTLCMHSQAPTAA
jgi:DNA polymerase-3 subunit delta